ncbi:MAG: hypothetical protein H7Y38_01160 [Armatimonadetes bacterium]|nr:hypothetical protein [Armatimonadota bacterium]
MKIISTLSLIALSATLSLTATLIGIAPVAAQSGSPTPTPGVKTAKPAKNTVVGNDYLVLVGKHTMWKSQVEKMHPEMRKQIVTISKANGNDYPITVGKRTVMASTLRRSTGDSKTLPATHSASCKNYLVQVGKEAVLASSVNCPMGKHEGGTKPMCCVSPIVAKGDTLPRCCQDVKAI